MKKFARLAIIGSGPSAIYLLKHLLGNVEEFLPVLTDIHVFEKSSELGKGMPYNRATTDKYNMCNISSAEIPSFSKSLVDWLHTLSDEQLAKEGIERGDIDEDEIYRRTTLGDYFRDQYISIIDDLRKKGLTVDEHVDCQVTDLVELRSDGEVEVRSALGTIVVDRVVIATGHAFNEPDKAQSGYYASPWPMEKLIPAEGRHYSFTIGTLGASLSAFDVVASLSHRHGKFVDRDRGLTFEPTIGAEDFKIVLHSSHGWLPHLQYEQDEPFREIYRHVDRDSLLDLRDELGYLSLSSYFDNVCRPALILALEKDRRDDIADELRRSDYTLEDFVEQMSVEHSHADPFAGMKSELPQAKRSLRKGIPIHWKEVLDDLIFTLNFHYDLLTAEDHLRYRKVVVPFLMNVIAAMPLTSAQTLLALHDAGKLELLAGRVLIKEKGDGKTVVEVDCDGEVIERTYRMFIDCSGQGSLDVDSYPFPALVQDGTVSPAVARFRDHLAVPELDESEYESVVNSQGHSALRLGGIAIDGFYRIIGNDGQPNDRIYDIAFPHVTGIRPYSYGLQASDLTAAIVVSSWLEQRNDASELPKDVETVTEVYDGVVDA